MIFVRMPGLSKGFKTPGEGFCTDYLYPDTGTRSGSYDDVSNDAEGCMSRCLARNADTTAFYLKGTQCGCSATTSGPCEVTVREGYQTYEITGTICCDVSNMHIVVLVH